ncbi:xaa-Pro aminopeptidase 3-like [Amphiura filiformis]|uniref:xaa-Pro aminopeptidase 3-like n=1 Tax=Amphiura filiformis TaxID=82378 RepID=UPI003B224E54
MKLIPFQDGYRLLRKPLMTIRRYFSKHVDGAVGSLQTKTSPSAVERCLGQPSPYTHTHLLKPGEITPGISQDEYRDRRNQLMAAINRSVSGRSSNHVVVVLSSGTMYMADDVPYPLRQNSNFLYLCGFQEPDSVLVLENIHGRDLPEHKSTLFVRNRDPDRELWDGPRSGIDGALEYIGVDEAYPVGALSEALHKYSLRDNLVVWYDFFRTTGVHDAFHQDVLSHLIIPCRSKGSMINIIEKTMHSIRVMKSAAECRLMRKSVSIASQAFAEVMKFSRPGINESTLYAKMDFECRIRDAEFLAYPPVVAGGDRANTLHYIANNQLIHDGEMVLMDAGCEYHGYASDITRTWPVNGKFSDAQAELYGAVLDVQEACIDRCNIGVTLDQIYSFMLTELGKRLQHLGIVSPKLSNIELYKAATRYCPHHIGHYLGMDVHDTPRVSRSDQLQPGMIVTIEPGLYIPVTDLSAPAKYRGIGIRIEDNILITDEEPQNLSQECPKKMGEIEAIMGTL